MAPQKPLTGSELIDCAKANSRFEIGLVSDRCGYGEDVESFKQNLKSSCAEMGIQLDSFYDLLSFEQKSQSFDFGVEIAPDSSGEL